jgi:lipid II:glycine glycyltransferase (peptidoglycan interpeptide bridge formation enzyme)
VARHEGEALAAIITVHYGKEATYLYGASSDERRNLMPAYALQWAAIRAAREAGCSTYDFYGIPPVDDPGHAMSGLYRFKTGFGGEIRHYPGGWDHVLRPVVYEAFRVAERARLFWHKSVRKRLGR